MDNGVLLTSSVSVVVIILVLILVYYFYILPDQTSFPTTSIPLITSNPTISQITTSIPFPSVPTTSSIPTTSSVPKITTTVSSTPILSRSILLVDSQITNTKIIIPGQLFNSPDPKVWGLSFFAKINKIQNTEANYGFIFKYGNPSALTSCEKLRLPQINLSYDSTNSLPKLGFRISGILDTCGSIKDQITNSDYLQVPDNVWFNCIWIQNGDRSMIYINSVKVLDNTFASRLPFVQTEPMNIVPKSDIIISKLRYYPFLIYQDEINKIISEK